MSRHPIIGIIGGVGPYAGIDLAEKIFHHTDASTDQEHLPLALLSYPGAIHDRTAFLQGAPIPNPGHALADIARQLESLGATVLGIPCNTAHAPPIYDVFLASLEKSGSNLRVIHLIDETARYVRTTWPEMERVGILSTTGTYALGLYTAALSQQGITPLRPDEHEQQNFVQPAIYDTRTGIKAHSRPVHPVAREALVEMVHRLKKAGAQSVILGCTELPLALPEKVLEGLPIIDSTDILARSLIVNSYPDRLKRREGELE